MIGNENAISSTPSIRDQWEPDRLFNEPSCRAKAKLSLIKRSADPTASES